MMASAAGVVTQDVISTFTGRHAFLSNFAASRFQFTDGITYPTAEHAFQAQKTALIDARMRLAGLSTPQDAKAAGRAVTLIAGWDEVRKRVMHEVVLAKFWENPGLAELLDATEDSTLIEGNRWHDNFWGDCAPPATRLGTQFQHHLHGAFPQLSGECLPRYHEPQPSQRSQPPRKPGRSRLTRSRVAGLRPGR